MADAAPCPVAFYHLTRSPLERALPRLLERAVAQGLRVLLRCGSQARLDALNTLLWTYDPASFLAHGGPGDGRPEDQPILLSLDGVNANRADALVLVDGLDAGDLSGFSRCLDLFDGGDRDAVAAARERWRRLEAAGHEVAYWAQTESGGWERRR